MFAYLNGVRPVLLQDYFGTTIGRAPSPGKHLGLFWREQKHQVFSPAAADET
jgi:hypothetical protein